MSLPRRQSSEFRCFQEPASFPREPDFSVVMPGVSKLRQAGEDRLDLEEALSEIPAHLFGRIAIFAGERHKMLPWSTVLLLLDAVGLDALCNDVGIARASVVWRRYHVKR